MSDAEEDVHRETDDEDETTDEEEEDSILAKTNAATSSLKAIFENQASKDDLDQFMEQHSEVIKHVEDSGTTFLHRIVNLVSDRDNGKPVNALNIKPLVARIIQMYPDHLRNRNEESQTPLYRAIYLKRFTWNLIEPMLSSCSDDQIIEDVLGATCSKGESLKTCLTLAFEKDLKLKALQTLIKHATENSLKLTDGSGMTPFHRAVQYEQCDDKRIGIIKLLLQKDTKILAGLKEDAPFQPVESFLDVKYKRMEGSSKYEVEYSVYTEHERSSKAYLASENKKKSQAMLRENPPRQSNNREVDIDHLGRDKNTPKTLIENSLLKNQNTLEYDDRIRNPDNENERHEKLSEHLDEIERERQRLRAEEGKKLKADEEQESKFKAERKNLRYQGSDYGNSLTRQPREKESPNDAIPNKPKIALTAVGSDHAPNTPLKRVSTTTFSADKDKRKAVTKSTQKKPDSKMLAKNSAVILKMLKLHYMRTRSIEMATSFLYGKSNLNGKKHEFMHFKIVC